MCNAAWLEENLPYATTSSVLPKIERQIAVLQIVAPAAAAS